MSDPNTRGFSFGYKCSNLFESSPQKLIPGPGSYNVTESYNSVSKRGTQQGTMGQRFLPKIIENPFVAPGTYNNIKRESHIPRITFTNSHRANKKVPFEAKLGPGEYDITKFWAARNNAVRFNNSENGELMKLIHQDNFPGPGSYDHEHKGLVPTMVSYLPEYLPKWKVEHGEFPGPASYDVKKEGFSRSVTFPKAKDRVIDSELKQISKFSNRAPNCYDIKAFAYDFMSKSRQQSIYSFPKSGRNLENIKLNNSVPIPTYEKEEYDKYDTSQESSKMKGISFIKSERAILSLNDNNVTPGPGYYHTETRDFINQFPGEDAKSKMRDKIVKINAKSRNIDHSSPANRKKILKHNMFQKKLKPFLEILQKNGNSPTKMIETVSARRKIPPNPLKVHILKKIEKTVEKKVKSKLNKELFIISNDAVNRRKDKGFGVSVRKHEYLGKFNLNPGPDKYELKTTLNPRTLPLSSVDRKSVFEVKSETPAPGAYEQETPIVTSRSRRKSGRRTSLFYAIKKVENYQRRKKLQLQFQA